MPFPLIISLTGRSGSGKGTQVKLLQEYFGNMRCISTGDLFRDLASQNTLVGKKIKQTIEKGELPFDDIAIALLLYEIAYKVKDGQGIIFDGVTRHLEEAKALDSFLSWLGQKDNVFHLLIDISREEGFHRLTKRRICKKCGRLIPWIGEFKKLKVCDKCGGELLYRSDDSEKAINSRLDFFDKQVAKVIDYYKKQGKLIRINGEQSIENVFQDILKVFKR